MVNPELPSDMRTLRLAKLEAIRAAGVDPYPRKTFEKQEVADILALPLETPVQAAGRVMLFREMGNITFFHIQDRSGRIQIMLNKRTFKGDYKFWLKKLDLGDIVHVVGTRADTQKGEKSIMADELTLVSKAILPLPEKWAGMADMDQIYRERQLDLITNAESFQRFVKRSQTIQGIREYLTKLTFLEVETPVLQGEAGGAAATPFVTHHKALDHDFVLRIATELHLKRMLVGGFERVFEIGKNFRNEGLSRKHNPEYTALEVYQAYSDYRGMMELLKGIVGYLCENIFHKWQFKHADSGQMIDFAAPWREVRYKDLVCERLNDPTWFSRTNEEKLAKAKELGVEARADWQDFEITAEIYGKKIEPTLIQPTFVTHMPAQSCPLAKINQEDPTVIDVFECIIAGMELAPAYTEQNDPIVQREVFMAQVGGDKQKFDNEFIEAIEHGMPSAGGMGIGIDRLVMILTEAASIRDVLLFPTLKPLGK